LPHRMKKPHAHRVQRHQGCHHALQDLFPHIRVTLGKWFHLEGKVELSQLGFHNARNAAPVVGNQVQSLNCLFPNARGSALCSLKDILSCFAFIDPCLQQQSFSGAVLALIAWL
jgi:hypothetical protein